MTTEQNKEHIAHPHEQGEHPHHSPEVLAEKKEEMKEGLKAIYGDEKEKIDFSKLERANTRFTSILLTVIVTLGLITITAWLGFFVYLRFFSLDKTENFELTMEVPEEVKSGEQMSVVVHYKNPTNIPLATLSIEMRLPEAFKPTITEPLPTSTEEMSWDIGSVASGADGAITLTGLWLAEVPSSVPFQAYADYRPSNFNADFQDIETVYITTTASVLTTEFSGPEEVRPGDAASYELKVKNTGSEAFSQIQLDLEIPNGFYLDASDPSIAAGSAPVWIFETMEAGEEKIVTFDGAFATDVSGFQYFDVQSSVVLNEKTYIQGSTQGYTDVLKTDLTLALAANGSTEDAVTKIGDTVNASLSIENSGSAPLASVSLLLEFDAEKNVPIDWGHASLDGGALTQKGINWSATTIGGLAAGEKRILNLSLPIDSEISISASDVFTMLASANVDGATIRSSPVTVHITTNAALSVTSRYFDHLGIPVGSGPLPPVVGSTSSYQVVWKLTNSLHDLENITLEGTLAPEISWNDVTTATVGSMTYEMVSRKVTWKILKLPTSTAGAEATFMVSATPDSGDIGSFIKLLSQSTLRATDGKTDTAIQLTVDGVTSECIGDKGAEGKGIVVE